MSWSWPRIRWTKKTAIQVVAVAVVSVAMYSEVTNMSATAIHYDTVHLGFSVEDILLDTSSTNVS